MSGLLAEICARTALHVKACKQASPLSSLEASLSEAPPLRPFKVTLERKVQAGGIGLIAEIKKASPSRGLIRADFNPAQHAQSYESAGAACLSVLTDVHYFQGCDDYLKQAKAACNLPVLRKDFTIDPYQVTEARAIGADCILIIMAALGDAQAQEIESAAHALGMDALIEVHDEDELARALMHLKSPLIGVNNRNLSSLKIDLETSRRLRPLMPDGCLAVCESGIKTHSDITGMRAADIHCFLVGESLMLQPDIASATQQLLGSSC